VLGILEIPSISQVNRNAGRPEGVAADFRPNSGRFGSPLRHRKDIHPVERPLRHDHDRGGMAARDLGIDIVA
jgi:hypothetical protein